jgi:hypothetical protein
MLFLVFLFFVSFSLLLDIVDSFNYLGSSITTEGGAERDIKVRIGKARSTFIRLELVSASELIVHEKFV